MNGVDLNRFEFDYDVTWNAFFLDEKLNVYSRFGGRDGGDPERRLHKDALLRTMRSVLEAHADARKLRDESSSGMTADQRAALLKQLVAPIAQGKFTPEDIPLLKQNHNGCVHCHQVREYQLLQWGHDGVMDRRKLFGWPLPENLGIELDFAHGTRVAKVEKESAAERSGVRSGDTIVRANDAPVRSEYDLRWVLHRAADDKPLRLIVERGRPVAESSDGPAAPKPERVTLDVPLQGEWRQTDLGWRKSMRSVPLEFGIRGYALTRSQRKELALGEKDLSLRIVNVPPRGLAKSLDLRKGDTITALGGRTGHRTFEQFLSDLLRTHEPGDEVEVTVIREGARVKLTGKLPSWGTEETAVP